MAMNWNESAATYKWMLRHYPNTHYMCNANDLKVECEIIHYEKRGTHWKEMEREREIASNLYYCNCVDAVPWFRNIGGRETVKCKYTTYGYIPYFISSLSPDRTQKVTREFKF